MQRFKWTSAVVTVALATLAISSIALGDDDGIVQKGKYWLRWKGPQLRAEVSYRWAQLNYGEEWMILRVSLAGEGGPATFVERDKITLRDPGGRTIPLVSSQDFRSAYNSIRGKLERADVWVGPSHTFLEGGRLFDGWFLMPPAKGRVVGTMNVQPKLVASGPMVFRVQGGTQPGRWVLTIELEESTARIPIEMVAK